jgi:uncharacterized protein (DUF885 family)
VSDDNGIEQLAQEYWDALMASEPTWAHMLGDYRYADRFEEASREAEDRDVARFRDFADRAEAIGADGLDADQEVSRAVLVADARGRADLLEARLRELAANPVFGDQTMLPVLMGMIGVPDGDVAEAMVLKIDAVGRYYEQLAERQREGLAAGRTSARFAVEGTVQQIDEALGTPVGEDPVLQAIRLPDGIDAAAWRERAARAIEGSLRPGMAAYRDVLRDEVLPQARDDDKVGLTWIPQGEQAYAATLRFFTSTDKSAQEIHDIGLAQVAKLADEYRALGPSVVGSDDLATIFDALRADPKLHFETSEQIVEASEVAMRRAWDAMPDWFEVLPKAPCAVEGTLTGAKAYYFPPASDGSRGGTFFVNVADAPSWGTFEIESLAFHEGIPGHHLQLAIADELPDSVPKIRKHLEFAAYAEGWGLYTERLAEEMGLYSSDTDRMGMLSADSMRACRLVVDTGIHALGWSRGQAVDYMVENSPMTRAMVQAEIDRYIVTPGQATAYMIGRLEIERMRREAEGRQGDAFDVRRFHSAVLDSGLLPLGVLDQVVAARLR